MVPTQHLIQLANNESALGPSPRAVAAAASALVGGRYPDPQARLLRAALARHHDRSPEEVCATAGASEAIQLLVRAFPGEVVVPAGSFPLYAAAAVRAGLRVRTAPRDASARVDLDALRRAITPDTRLVFLACPDNPTGTTPAGLRRWLTTLPAHVIPVVDQAYAELDDAPDLTGAHPQLVTLRSFSKAYGLAGLRVGCAIGPTPCITALDAVRDPFNVSAPAEAAAIAALHDRAWLVQVRQATARGRASLAAELGQRGLHVLPGAANFVYLPRARGLADLLVHHGVQVRRLDAWGHPDAVRVTVGLPHEHAALLRAVDAGAAIRPVHDACTTC
jgi:histidinol-phosphate aminotransferase